MPAQAYCEYRNREIDQALQHAPGAGLHVEDVLRHQRDRHGSQAGDGGECEQAINEYGFHG